MRAGHTSLKASLNRFNIVSKAKCECGDGLQTEDLIVWNCKRYEEQRATMRNILSENSKKEYPKSVTELPAVAVNCKLRRFLSLCRQIPEE
jgi:hypothetical protein